MKANTATPASAWEVKRTAEDLMTRDVVTVTPDTSAERAMQMMDSGYFRHLPVVQAGALAGIVSIRDLVKHRVMALPHGLPPLGAAAAGAQDRPRMARDGG